jgi:membrane protease YdiL (CAAX protease family)
MPALAPSSTLEPVSFSPLSAPPAKLSHRFTRREAVGLGAASSVFGLGSVGVDYLPAPPFAGLKAGTYYHYGTETLAAVPIAVASPLDALEVGDWTVALAEGSLALRYNGARQTSSSLGPYWAATESYSLHHGFYAGYVAYRDARVSGSSSVWDDAWRPYTADELVVSPLHWSNINHPVVWAGISADAGITGIVVGVELATKIAPPAPPGAVARNLALGTLTSWDAGITEEPLFRGFFYEELQLSLGRWPARAIDMTLFTLAHVPGEIGQPPIVILAGVADRAASGLLFEIAYDQGGLLESAAFHVLFDVADNLVTSFVGTSPAAQRRGLGYALGPAPAPGTIGLGGPLTQPIHQVFSLSLPL